MKTKSDLWKNHQIDMLNEILQTGTVQPKYLHSRGKRCRAVFYSSLLATTCCIPCFIWDGICCCVSVVVKENPCRWGFSCTFFDNFCKETYHDTRQKELQMIKRTDVYPEHLYQVAQAYLQAFDTTLKNNNPKIANQLRADLVYLIAKYSNNINHTFLQDNGDILFLRHIVEELRN